MAVLRAKKRNSLPASDFGLPGERKYPVFDKGHAIAAKSRASQMEARGRITPAQKAAIDAKANRKLNDHDFAHKRPRTT